jgi:hypothetical protein
MKYRRPCHLKVGDDITTVYYPADRRIVRKVIKISPENVGFNGWRIHSETDNGHVIYCDSSWCQKVEEVQYFAESF